MKEYFHFYVAKCDILHRLTCRNKATSVSSEPARWSCDVCQRMPDFDSCQFIFIWMAYITYWVMPICARFNVTFDIGVHVGVLQVGRQTLRQNKTLLHPQVSRTRSDHVTRNALAARNNEAYVQGNGRQSFYTVSRCH